MEPLNSLSVGLACWEHFLRVCDTEGRVLFKPSGVGRRNKPLLSFCFSDENIQGLI